MDALWAWIVLFGAVVAWLMLATRNYDERKVCAECFGTGSRGNRNCPVCRGRGRI
jgi:hypothetical protein